MEYGYVGCLAHIDITYHDPTPLPSNRFSLHRLDSTSFSLATWFYVVNPQPFPRFEERKPIVGIMIGDNDLPLRLRA